MINLAGVSICDLTVTKELDEAEVSVHSVPFILEGEVPTSIFGTLDGWEFRRLWKYWVVTSKESLMLFKYADELFDRVGDVVRINGSCGTEAPMKANTKPWHLGVSTYHVDTQHGLNVLCEIISEQTKESSCW